MELPFVCPVVGRVFSSSCWETRDLAVVLDADGKKCLRGRVRVACPLCGGWHDFAPEELACPLAGAVPDAGEDRNGKGGA